MPEIIIVAGPNGAGKTKFASEYLARERFNYVNADVIARELDNALQTPSHRDLRAAREMLSRIDDAIGQKLDVMIETTLASLTYAQKIPRWRSLGYRVTLHYLRLPTPERSIERVRLRVARGGHNIPEAIIRQRFTKSLDYLEKFYKHAVDRWYIWDSLEGEFKFREASQNQ